MPFHFSFNARGLTSDLDTPFTNVAQESVDIVLLLLSQLLDASKILVEDCVVDILELGGVLAPDRGHHVREVAGWEVVLEGHVVGTRAELGQEG